MGVPAKTLSRQTILFVAVVTLIDFLFGQMTTIDFKDVLGSAPLVSVVVAVAAVLVSIFYTWFKPLPAGVAPGTRGWPLVGEFLEWSKDYTRYYANDWYCKKIQKYRNGAFRTNMFFMDITMIYGKNNFRKVLNAEHNEVSSSYLPATVECLGKNGLVFLPKNKHKIQRSILMRAFTPAAIESYLPSIEVIIRDFWATWARDQTVAFGDGAAAVFFEIARKVILGLDVGADPASAARVRALYSDVREGTMTPLAYNFPLIETAFKRGMRARKALLALMDEQLTTFETSRADAASSGVMMHLLMNAKDEEGNSLTREELLDQILFLLFAAFDTSTSTIGTVMLCLGLHPEAIVKMREEQRRIIAKHGEKFTNEAINEMVYCDAVIREAMRIRPSVPNMIRRANEPFKVGDYLIPKGMLIFASIRSTHLNEFGVEGIASGAKHMTFEEGFQPERWLDEATKPQHWFGFGGGPRLCLGMSLANAQMRTLLAVMVRHYDIELLNKSTEQAPSAFPKYASGLPLSVKKRTEGL